MLACGGGAPNSASPSDAGVSFDASDETIIVTSDATAPEDASNGDSATTDSAAPGDTGPVGDTSTSETGVSCEAGTVDCNGVCVNEQTDPSHCGSCSKVCPGPDAGMGLAQCTSGMCSVTCNGSTTLDCSGTCFDPNDPDHCGSCSTVCPAPSNGNGSATCTGSTPTCGISCNSGYHLCSGACDSSSDDPSVTTDPCILTETYGVFVATPTSGGSDANGTGTRAKPYATISHALTNLNGLARVYVCGGSYSDQVSVTTPVSIYGGLTCAGGTWQYVAGTIPIVTSATAAFALRVSGVSGRVLVEDMAFTSPTATGTDGNGNGLSSTAALVNASTNVTFVRTTLTAGQGAAGSTGAGGSSSPNYSGPTAPSGSAGGASGSAGGDP